MRVGTTLSVLPWHLPQSGNEYTILVTKGEGLAYIMIVIDELVPPLMLGIYNICTRMHVYAAGVLPLNGRI